MSENLKKDLNEDVLIEEELKEEENHEELEDSAELLKKRTKLMTKYFKKNRGKEVLEANAYILEDIENAINRAEDLIDEDGNYSEPLVILTPEVLYEEDKLSYRVTETEEGNFIIHHNQSLITSLFLTNQTMFYHKANINHINGKFDNELVGDLSLFDIVHIQTSLDMEETKDLNIFKVFLTLNLVDGDTVTFNLRKEIVDDVNDFDTSLNEDEKYIIKTIRKAVRQSK